MLSVPICIAVIQQNKKCFFKAQNKNIQSSQILIFDGTGGMLTVFTSADRDKHRSPGLTRKGLPITGTVQYFRINERALVRLEKNTSKIIYDDGVV
jgi:hypothetical protein